jgi:uncharacterized membrane protein
LKWNLDFRMKKQLFLLLVVSAVLLQCSFFANAISLEQAIQQRTSNVQVKGTGTVIRLLKDDNRGSRHQKFILKLASNKTILIAHNIDLAPRINAISTGDIIAFYGEYEWNNKGGVVHWTHHDPNGHHIGGWLKHNGNTYQ